MKKKKVKAKKSIDQDWQRKIAEFVLGLERSIEDPSNTTAELLNKLEFYIKNVSKAAVEEMSAVSMELALKIGIVLRDRGEWAAAEMAFQRLEALMSLEPQNPKKMLNSPRALTVSRFYYERALLRYLLCKPRESLNDLAIVIRRNKPIFYAFVMEKRSAHSFAATQYGGFSAAEHFEHMLASLSLCGACRRLTGELIRADQDFSGAQSFDQPYRDSEDAIVRLKATLDFAIAGSQRAVISAMRREYEMAATLARDTSTTFEKILQNGLPEIAYREAITLRFLGADLITAEICMMTGAAADAQQRLLRGAEMVRALKEYSAIDPAVSRKLEFLNSIVLFLSAKLRYQQERAGEQLDGDELKYYDYSEPMAELTAAISGYRRVIKAATAPIEKVEGLERLSEAVFLKGALHLEGGEWSACFREYRRCGSLLSKLAEFTRLPRHLAMKADLYLTSGLLQSSARFHSDADENLRAAIRFAAERNLRAAIQIAETLDLSRCVNLGMLDFRLDGLVRAHYELASILLGDGRADEAKLVAATVLPAVEDALNESALDRFQLTRLVKLRIELLMCSADIAERLQDNSGALEFWTRAIEIVEGLPIEVMLEFGITPEQIKKKLLAGTTVHSPAYFESQRKKRQQAAADSVDDELLEAFRVAANLPPIPDEK